MWLDRYKNYTYLILLGYLLGFNYAVFHSSVNLFSVDETEHSVIRLSQFEAAPLDSPEQHQSQNLNWQSVHLPDDWTYHEQNNPLWIYRIELNKSDVNAEQLAIYLPSVTHNVAVYINDIWIGQSGTFSDPVSRHHNEPLLFSFSPSLLHNETNTLKLIVKAAYYQQGLLDEVYLGDHLTLSNAHDWKYFIRVDFIRWVTVAMYALSGLIMLFWLSRPQDVIYGIFSIELFFWATHNLNLFVSNIPVSSRLWEAMTMSTLGWTVIAMIFFNHRFVGYSSKRVEQFILLFGFSGIGIFFLPDIASILTIGYRIWDSFLLVFGSYAILHLLYAYVQKTSTDIYLMLLAGIPILVFGLHDILMVNHFIDRRDGLIIQYSVVPAALLFTWFLVRRFVQSLNKAEQLAHTLESRVKQKQLALHQQYEQLKHLEKETVLSEERERIMRDMHDGIGGQLVSTLVMLQDCKGEVYDKIRHKIEHSLTDLRFVIDSLDPLLSDIPTLLGMMRLRLLDQLEAANIELEWEVTELPEVADMSPRRCLHIMRIVQEAINNSIKHSSTDKMRLQTGILDNKNIYIDIHDYGSGLQQCATFSGRGIDNMNYRASEIGGNLEMLNTDTGFCVRLVLQAANS